MVSAAQLIVGGRPIWLWSAVGNHERRFPRWKRPPWTCRRWCSDGEITRLGYRRLPFFTECNGAFSARPFRREMLREVAGLFSGYDVLGVSSSRIGASDRCANVAHMLEDLCPDSGRAAIRISPTSAPRMDRSGHARESSREANGEG